MRPAGPPGTLPRFLSTAWNTGRRPDPEPRAPASVAPPEAGTTGGSKALHLSSHLGSRGLAAATLQGCKEGRKNQIWVQVLTLPTY